MALLAKPVLTSSGTLLSIRPTGPANGISSVIPTPAPFKDASVLIIPGKVKHLSHSTFIQISKIESPKIYTYSDKLGEFKVKLAAGEYTFFLVINKMGYLNSFDKYGNFTSTLIDSNVDDLIITDFRGAVF